jgi:hypothetical protein
MNLNKYIEDNLDDILDNNEEFIINSKIVVKKEDWLTELEKTSKIVDLQNEEEFNQEEYEQELYEELYNKKLNDSETIDKNKENKDNKENKENKDNEDNEDNLQNEHYLLKLLNLYMIHHNEKYNKNVNFFTGIKNNSTDTTNQMELFFEAIIEFKMIKNTLGFDDDNECIEYYFNESQEDEIKEMMNKFKGQIYYLEYNNNKIYTPSLIICLSWILNNKTDIYTKDWFIFNLRDN